MVLVEGNIRKSFLKRLSSVTADSSSVKFTPLIRTPLRKPKRKKFSYSKLLPKHQTNSDSANKSTAKNNPGKKFSKYLFSYLRSNKISQHHQRQQQQLAQQEDESEDSRRSSLNRIQNSNYSISENHYSQYHLQQHEQAFPDSPTDNEDNDDQPLLTTSSNTDFTAPYVGNGTCLTKSQSLLTPTENIKKYSKIPRPPPPPRTVSTCVLGTQRPSSSTGQQPDSSSSAAVSRQQLKQQLERQLQNQRQHLQKPQIGAEYLPTTESVKNSQLKILQEVPFIAQPVNHFTYILVLTAF
uniref:WH2 domain-containing protein n=1 Tax=Syphacia muris TaxID=451379 RepID=A0A0N5AEF7_9BILA